jgi:hypothetical protein
LAHPAPPFLNSLRFCRYQSRTADQHLLYSSRCRDLLGAVVMPGNFDLYARTVPGRLEP